MGQLQVWKMTIELFQYSSERINTGIAPIDEFETLKTFDIEQQPNIDEVDSFGDNQKFDRDSTTRVIRRERNPFGE